ncbi:MAG: polysaccharide biosynthesis protein [Clostridiales bacterium]|nr:polysaccharide biosynthesis protein [Clostridiales bacterium]
MTSNPGKSIARGISILSVAGIICKLIGLLFSVPLTRIIGSEGLGIFQSVYPTYNLLLTLSSAGLPVAVSRMVSQSLARENPRGALHVFRTALWILTGLGCVCTILMIVGNGALTAWVREPRASAGFNAIAPCLAIVCTLSAFRGFMQGQQNMKPTAYSQIIEQAGKVTFSLPLAWLGAKQSLAMGAAGALLGVTISEACATLAVAVFYYRSKPAFARIPQVSEASLSSARSLTQQLFVISIPITVSACIVPLAQFVDSVMMVPRMIDSGLTNEVSRSLYGVFSGLVIRLINIPTALALAIAMSLVPAVSAAQAVHDEEGTRQASSQGLKLAFLIGFPCSIGMSVLARQIFGFLYQESLSPEHFQTGWELLTVSSLTVVLFTVVQATSGILQGLGKQRIPMYTLIAGVGCKILMNYILVGIPGLNIHGGPYASIVCYSVSMIPNLYYVCKYAHLRFRMAEWVGKPALSAAVMGLAVWALRTVLPMNRLLTLLEVAVGVAVYGFTAYRLGALPPEDLGAITRRLRRKGKNRQ